MKKNKIEIVKASGDRVDYNPQKLRNSLERARATEEVIETIIAKIESSLYTGITTKEIYIKAFELLKQGGNHTAARYKLKNAIFELGPTGFPFEKFVAQILQTEGYKASVGVIMNGSCVSHEVDVLAEKENLFYMIECKFHNEIGITSNVKTPLYIQSRFKDLEAELKKSPKHKSKIHKAWIITNTRFTEDAIKYSNCVGIKLLSWDYPKSGSLKDKIDNSGLHPITCLTTITTEEKQQLLEKNKLFSMDICNNPSLLKEIKISDSRQEKILSEAQGLCGIKT